MVLIYRFKKETLKGGGIVSRPRINILLRGKTAIQIPALIDSGCDITVIPEGIANAIGIDTKKGKKDKLYAYRESTDVVQSEADITFLGKEHRQSVTIKIPVLIALKDPNFEEESDITLGVNGIFDNFDITFSKSKNKITLKKVEQQI